MSNVKNELKERARLLRGLATAFGCDAEYIFTDAKNIDLICLNESVKEARYTVQRITDNIKEIEYLMYLMQQDES